MTNKIKCEYCNKEFSKMGIKGHIWRMHGDGRNFNPNAGYSGGKVAWNKGLTKETDPRLEQAGKTYSARCKSGEIIPSQKGKPLSEEHKNNVSKGMKKAHAEGRAWNIGMSRWNNEPSYPEKFFMKVIEKEINDKNYIHEYPCIKYSIDFAWADKKLAIEIDGEQHQRFEEYRERDKRKDKALAEEGWQVLRIAWKDMFADTKYWISVAKDFIDN